MLFFREVASIKQHALGASGVCSCIGFVFFLLVKSPWLTYSCGIPCSGFLVASGAFMMCFF